MQYLGNRRSADSLAYMSATSDSPDPIILCGGTMVSWLLTIPVDARTPSMRLWRGL
jgi:hypothetical protein